MKIIWILMFLILLSGCSTSLGTYSFPEWLATGQWREVTTSDWPSYWYFEADSITLQYQDPDYHYISVEKYIIFWPAETTTSSSASTFILTKEKGYGENYTVTVTCVDSETIAVDFPALQALGGGEYIKTEN